MADPSPLWAALAEQMEHSDPGSREYKNRRSVLIEHSMCADRRRSVLAHEDLAARLTEHPLEFCRAQNWNGWIPPDTFNGEHNDSPRRIALSEIAAEAWERDHQ